MVRSGLLVLACACNAAILAAQLSSPAGTALPVQPAPAPATGTTAIRVFGQVTDAETSRPLRGALVVAMPRRLADGTVAADARAAGVLPTAARTDAEGRFAMTDLEPGEYVLVARRSGYVQQQLGQATPSTPGRQLVVERGAVAGPLEFALMRSAVISGRVVDAYGAPADRVTVRAARLHHVAGVARLRPTEQATTDDLGEFRVFGLPPGRYVLSAEPAVPFESRGAFVSRPEREAVVTFAPSVTSLHEAEAIHVGPGDEAETQIHLVEAIVGTIEGRVVDSRGVPVTDGFAGLMSRGGWRVTQGATVPVNADGTFAIHGVTPGAYTVTISPRMHPGTSDELAVQLARSEIGRLDVDVSGDLPGLVVKTQPATTVRGRLVIDGDATRLRGRDVRVQATPTGPPGTWNGQARARVRPDLSFELVGVRGEAVLRLGGVPDGWWTRTVRIGRVDATDGHDFGVARTIADVEIVVSTRPSGLRGRVTTAAQAPAGDAIVIGFDEDAHKWGRPVVANTFMVRPVEDGTWSIDGLRPGRYRLIAVPVALARGDDIGDPDYLAQLSPRARPVVIGEGQTPEVTLVVSEP